ncbi:ABC transporter ATP-binding protein [Nonomuraea sp. NPDC050310]|uniref:ABC transporter ATP-binding protein n=1 Tax=Nonomuraea sp. NPDC050310 TaxID=3154935 RepID=UPI0033CA3217
MRGRLGALAGWSLVEALPGLWLGLALARAVDDGFAAGRPGTGLAWLGVLGLAWVVGAFGARQVVLVVAGIVEPFRERLLDRLVRGALRTGGTAAVARVNLQVELARDALAAVISVIRAFVFGVLAVLAGLAALAPGLLVLIVPPLLLGLGLFAASLPALARRHRAYLLADERTTEAVTTVVGGLRDITAAGAESRVEADLDAHIGAQARAGFRLARTTGARTIALALGGWAPVVLVLLAAPRLEPGVVLGALAYVTQSLVPALGSLVENLGASAVRLSVALSRVLEAAPPEPPPVLPEPGRDGSVRLRGVRFAYGPHAAPVLDGFDLDLREGEHLAVVGPSGIGKSTLASLVTGLLKPDAGHVRVGGARADLLDPAWRTLAPQDAYVFKGSLRENLAYFGTGPVREAARALGAEELLDRLGDEVDPARLSPAERQLLVLVRTYLSPARIVVLDEATCHLDPAAEARAEEAFAARGGTLIVIAHRLSSALRAQRVLVMDGTGVALGTHAELLAGSPLYADLVGRWTPAEIS